MGQYVSLAAIDWLDSGESRGHRTTLRGTYSPFYSIRMFGFHGAGFSLTGIVKNFVEKECNGDFRMDIIKKSGVRQYVGKNVGSDVYQQLDERVKDLLDRAEARADENQRHTVLARDI